MSFLVWLSGFNISFYLLPSTVLFADVKWRFLVGLRLITCYHVRMIFNDVVCDIIQYGVVSIVGTFQCHLPVTLCCSSLSLARSLTLIFLHSPLLYLRYVSSISMLGGSMPFLKTIDDNKSACISNSSLHNPTPITLFVWVQSTPSDLHISWV